MKEKVNFDNYYFKKAYNILFDNKIIIISVILMISIVLILTITPNTASAENNVRMVKSVIVYHIEAGDTIWSIAEEYYSPECGKLTDYIREIKKCNGLVRDTIYIDNYLIIPYYKPQ